MGRRAGDDITPVAAKTLRARRSPRAAAACLAAAAFSAGGASDALANPDAAASPDTAAGPETVAHNDPIAIAIEAQDLEAALLEFSQQSGVQVIIAAEAVREAAAPRIAGFMTPREAVRRLLERTGLDHEFVSDDTVVVGHLRRARGGEADLAPLRPRDQAAASEDRLLITGTRIPRNAYNTALLTTVFTSDDISSSGQNDLGAVLLEIPSVVSSLSVRNTQTSTQNSGLSSVNLRNLGSNRTLVLIDGRRAVSNSANGFRVSLDTIPIEFVERIEVTTGGASAVYGSDAIAGVVNIILRSELDGFSLHARGGAATAGGGEQASVAGLFGAPFRDGRGSFMGMIGYYHEGRIGADQRDFATRSVLFDKNLNTTITPNLSPAIPGGTFEGSRFFFTKEGLQENFDRSLHGFEFRPALTLSIPREKLLAAFKARYEIGESAVANLSAQFADIHSLSTRAPDPLRSSQVGEIPLDNPFIPQPIRDDALARGETGIDFQRRMVELGLRSRENDRSTVRLWADASGALPFDWAWQASYGFGASNQSQSRRNDVAIPNFQFAVDVEPDPDSPGAFRCRDAIARRGGCAPLNLFGVGSISPEAADYIRLTDSLDARIRQHVITAYAAGDLIAGPKGGVSAVFGFEHRRERSRTRVDPLTSAGLTTLAQIPNIDGGFEAWEGFFESAATVSPGVPFADEISFDAAARVASYSHPNVDTVVSYRAGGDWAFPNGVRLRGQFARSQRAPDITELFSPVRGDFQRVDDPCDNVTATSAGVVAENCRATPAIAAAIAQSGMFEASELDIFTPNSGNIDLREETANAVTAGVILAPAAVPGLSLSLDYYRINIRDAIDAIGDQVLLDQCYQDQSTFPTNLFCREITRDDAGQIARIDNRLQNINRILASGIDTSLDVAFDMNGRFGLTGAMHVRAIHSYILKLEESFAGVDGVDVVDIRRGEIGDFAHLARLTIDYEDRGAKIRWRSLYTGPALDSIERRDFFRAKGVDDPLFLRVGSEVRHDLYAHYEWGGARKFRVYAGINNIFNNTGPFLPSGTVSGRSGNFHSEYDIVGRFIYAGVSLAL